MYLQIQYIEYFDDLDIFPWGGMPRKIFYEPSQNMLQKTAENKGDFDPKM